jgi:hypothetical protein
MKKPPLYIIAPLFFWLWISFMIILKSILNYNSDWKYFDYCSDWQMVQWLEMFTWKVVSRDWNLIAVEWYYRYSKIWCVGVIWPKWCNPEWYVYQTWYWIKVFDRKYCISSNPEIQYKDIIQNYKNEAEPLYDEDWCRRFFKERYNYDFQTTNLWKKYICNNFNVLDAY